MTVSDLQSGPLTIIRDASVAVGAERDSRSRSTSAFERAQVAIVDLGREHTVLVENGSSPRYMSTGHIVYGRENALWAVGFDDDQLEVTTTPIPVLEGVKTKPSGAVNFDLSEDGTVVHLLDTLTNANERMKKVRVGRT